MIQYRKKWITLAHSSTFPNPQIRCKANSMQINASHPPKLIVTFGTLINKRTSLS